MRRRTEKVKSSSSLLKNAASFVDRGGMMMVRVKYKPRLAGIASITFSHLVTRAKLNSVRLVQSHTYFPFNHYIYAVTPILGSTSNFLFYMCTVLPLMEMSAT